VLAAAFWEYGGPEAIRWAEVPDPRPGPRDVVIDVRACGVNHSDLDSRAGTSRWPFTFPWVLGAEFAGVVREVGAETEGVEPGQPVTALQQYACGECEACGRWRPDLCPRLTVFGTDCWGGYAELVRAPARALVPLDSREDFLAVAASQCVVSTAWSMVTSLAAVRAGETVLVPSASGGVAGAAVQCAKIAGARVIASVGAPEKIERVEELGADGVFCYRDWPVRDAVAELTDGRGVDAVVDTVGGPLFSEHLAVLRPDGRLVTCGAHAGEVVPLDIIELFRRGSRILGFRLATPDESQAALRMVLEGRIRVPVDRTFEMSAASDAHAYMGERNHVGKIVLVRS
jgi:NADPH:quinone reductase-like Zn-dependent oxidoreductase